MRKINTIVFEKSEEKIPLWKLCVDDGIILRSSVLGKKCTEE
jgi:hypothetical protein